MAGRRDKPKREKRKSKADRHAPQPAVRSLSLLEEQQAEIANAVRILEDADRAKDMSRVPKALEEITMIIMSWGGTEFHDELNRTANFVVTHYDSLPSKAEFWWTFSEFLEYALTCADDELRRALQECLVRTVFDRTESLVVPDYSDYVVWGDEKPEPPREGDFSRAESVVQLAESIARSQVSDSLLRAIIRAGVQDSDRLEKIHAYVASMGLRQKTLFERLFQEESAS